MSAPSAGALLGGLHQGGGGRPRVAVVTSSFGKHSGEKPTAIRLLAGALALSSDVSVVSLEETGDRPATERTEGIFPVHAVASASGEPRLAEILTAALARRPRLPSSTPLSDIAAERLLDLERRPPEAALRLLSRLRPDVVLLTGLESLALLDPLAEAAARPRLVVFPLAGPDGRLASPFALAPVRQADAVLAASRGERVVLEQAGIAHSRLRQIRIPFPVNPQAADSVLAGTASFGPYVVVIAGWHEDPAWARAPGHDYIRSVAGDVSVAEVRHGRWLVSERGRHFRVKWPASRMNLWRLMASAIATMDVRPPGPVGRETLESLLFATPVVVPAGSVAAEHAELSNGGLWYDSIGEGLEALAQFVEDRGEAAEFGRAGREWALREHSDTERFVSEATEAVVA